MVINKCYLPLAVFVMIVQLVGMPALAIPLTTTFDYDIQAGTVTHTDANNQRTKVTTDSIGNVVKIELLDDPSGNKIFKYDYDETNQLWQTTFPQIGNSTTQEYGYDDLDRLESIKEFNIADILQFKYDHKNRPTWIDYGLNNGQVCYEYDADGRVTRVGRVPSGSTATFCNDAIVEKTNYIYDVKGRPDMVTYPNGVSTIYKYYPVTGLIENVTNRKGNNQLIFSERFTYFPNTNLYKSVTRTTPIGVETISYNYDNFQRLDTVTEADGRHTNFYYDEFGNRTREVISNINNSNASGGSPKAYGEYKYVYKPGSSRLARIIYNARALETFEYDNAGRIVKRNHLNDGVTSYTYDDRGLLSHVTKPSLEVSFTYDALGTRKSKTVNGVTSYYITAALFGHQQVLMELNETFDVQSLYAHSGNVLIKYEPTPSNRNNDLYLLRGGTVGSIVQELNMAGDTISRHRYDSFGMQILDAVQNNEISGHGYTGERFDTETGLIYLRARYLDPSIGRFISGDPFPGLIDNPSTQNAYLYVSNNPILDTDPSGLIAQCVGGAIWGLGVDIFAQWYAGNGYSTVRTLSSVGVGCLTAGIGVAFQGLKTGEQIAFGAGANAVLSGGAHAANNVYEGEDFDKNLVENMVLNGILGGGSAAISVVGAKAPQHLDKVFKHASNFVSNAGSLFDITSPTDYTFSDISGIGIEPPNFVDDWPAMGINSNEPPNYVTDWNAMGMNFPNYIEGVLLDKTLSLLNGVEDIKAAAYDPVTGEVIFIGEGIIPSDEQINIDDLVVALRAVYVNNTAPGITFDSIHEGISLEPNQWAVKYFGQTENTQFGQILYDADYILKLLSLGITADGRNLKTLGISEFSSTPTDPGFSSFAERLFADNTSLKMTDDFINVEFLFRPLSIVLEEHKAGTTERDKKSFKFTDVRMQVNSRLINMSGDILTYDATNNRIIVDNPITGAKPSITDLVTVNQIKTVDDRAREFAQYVTDQYDSYADIVSSDIDFSVLKKLKRLAKITGLVRWLRENNIPIDISFLRDYQATAVSTPTTVSSLQVCRDPISKEIADSGSGPVDNLSCTHVEKIVGDRILGGIIYDVSNCAGLSENACQLVVEDPLITEALAARQANNLNLNPVSPADMQWNIPSQPTMTAIAQQLVKTYKDGNISFASTDLVFPNKNTDALAFTRYYNSFSTETRHLGPGWSALPYSLQFPQPKRDWIYCDNYIEMLTDNVACNEAGPEYIYPYVNLVDRVSGEVIRYVPIEMKNYQIPQFLANGDPELDENGNQVTISVDRPVYASDRGNDLLYEKGNSRFFELQQRDQHYQVKKRVGFVVRGTDQAPLYYADPLFVVRVTGVDGEGNRTFDQLSYTYNDKYNLEFIIGDFVSEGSATPLANPYKIELQYTAAEDRIESVSFSSPDDGTRTVEFGYTTDGRLETVTKAGRIIKYQYVDLDDPRSGLIDQIIDVTRNNEIIVKYDKWDLEQRVGSIQPQGQAQLDTTTKYDRRLGETEHTVVDQQGNNQITTIYRDDRQRVTDTSFVGSLDGQAINLTTGILYEDPNQLAGPTTLKDVRGSSRSISYDDDGNVVSVTNAKLHSTKFDRGYDVLDDMPVLLITDAKNRVSAIKYDIYGRVTHKFPRVVVESLTIDPATKRVSIKFQTDPLFKGYAVSYHYDENGNMENVTNASALMSAEYPWIAADEVTQYLDRNQFGQARTIISAAGFTTTNIYDGLARLESTAGPTNVSATKYTYHPSGLQQDSLDTVTTSVGSVSHLSDYVARSSTVTNARGIKNISYYNSRGQLDSIEHISPTTGTTSTTNYFYTDFGQLSEINISDKTNVEFDYDSLGRLKHKIVHEENVVSTPLDCSVDTDLDGANDCTDSHPSDPNQSGANVDSDGDGVIDRLDAFPNNPDEQYDTDGDRIGNNADLDDDNDGVSDVDEIAQGTHPQVNEAALMIVINRMVLNNNNRKRKVILNILQNTLLKKKTPIN